MTLRQLIDTARRMFLDDPLDIDNPDDNLWLDSELTLFANDAQREAARRANLIFDSTTANLALFPAVTAQFTNLDSRVIGVNEVLWDGIPLVNKSLTWLNANRPGWRTSSGVPAIYCIHEERVILVPAPATAGELTLELHRLPLEDMTLGGATRSMEIPDEHSVGLAHWVAHKAYLKQDTETYNPQKSDEHAAHFTDIFGPQINAADERLHRNKNYEVVNFGNILTS